MSTDTRHRSFITAGQRRWRVPLTAEFLDVTTNEPITLRFRTDVDGLALLAAIGRLGQMFAFARRPMATIDPDSPLDGVGDVLDMIKSMEDASAKSREYLHEFITPEDRERYTERVAPGLSLVQVLDVLRWIQEELSSLDPTRPALSGPASKPDGESLPAPSIEPESTPELSRSID